MSQLIHSPRGTFDILPADTYRWKYMEERLCAVSEAFGYRQIRIPTFEHTDLFARGVGDSTDIVGKEMYTMQDKGGRSITLRPEGTAGVVRAFLQHGVLKETLPAKAYYIISSFRYEKPGAGRYREFHQFGIELFGAPSPDADLEVIAVGSASFQALGIKNVRIEINSIGCGQCRPQYHAALKNFFSPHLEDMCDSCKVRFDKNPLRMLDCKSEVCAGFAAGAPNIFEYICDECDRHFSGLCALLDDAGIEYTVNPKIVRGLDYYSKTVFEFIYDAPGAPGTVCGGGGRYDLLTEYLGGDPCAGIGFGMGLERILMIMDQEGVAIPKLGGPDVFVAYIGRDAKAKARELVHSLIKNGLSATYDLNDRSLKAQLKYADKSDCRFSVVIGDSELSSGTANLRNMADGEQREVSLDAAAVIDGVNCFLRGRE